MQFEYDLAKSIAGENELLFVIYGGGKDCKQFAELHNCIYITPMVVIRNSLKSQQKIYEGVAFINEDMNDVKHILSLSTDRKFEHQIQDFRNAKKLLDCKESYLTKE